MRTEPVLGTEKTGMSPAGAVTIVQDLLPPPKTARRKKAKGKLVAFRPEPDQLAYLKGLKDDYNLSEVLRLGVSLYREVDAKLSPLSRELIEFARSEGLLAAPGDDRAWLPVVVTRLALKGLEARRLAGTNGGQSHDTPSPSRVRRLR